MCPRRGLFGLPGDEGLHLGSSWREGGVKRGRSRILGCVGPKGGARALDGLPGTLLRWVWGGGLWFFLPPSFPSSLCSGGEFGGFVVPRRKNDSPG